MRASLFNCRMDIWYCLKNQCFNYFNYHLKDALSDLGQFLANESPLKMMKNAFYFTLKVIFVLKIFKFLP